MNFEIKDGLWKSRFNIYPFATILSLLLIVLLFLLRIDSVAESAGWRKLDEGLYFGEFKPNKKSQICDNEINIIKIEPEFYSFTLLSASEHGYKLRTLKQWCSQFGLRAAINASMYQIDYLKSTGYMRNYRHINNPHINKSLGSLMAFNPVDPSFQDVRIIDR
ncbi:hypothetical protein ACFLZG_07855, partial [Thermodesulfobacteriota bacterium]